MSLGPQIVAATSRAVVLGTLLCSAALAADGYDARRGGSSLPAVDGLNAKISGFGGAAKDQGVYGAAGSVTMPLGHRYGLQIDGLGAGFDSDLQGNITIGGTAGHLFWRDPSVGLLGAYGHYGRADLSGSDFWAAGAEGALYLKRLTFEGIAGVEGGPRRAGAGGGLGSDPRFFEIGWLAYYPADNLRLSIGQSYGFESYSTLFGAEWGAWPSGKAMTSLFALGKVAENGDGAVLGGVRIYLGNSPKSLIRRNREDDPADMGTFSWSINYGLCCPIHHGGIGGQ
ncbi:MAG: hypothetical protein AB7V40_09330 [Methyloceanibacter sp.]